MISTNSLAAFAQQIARPRPGAEPTPTQRSAGPERTPPDLAAAERVAQRKLEAVPPAPAHPLPRGSLLDLRV